MAQASGYMHAAHLYKFDKNIEQICATANLWQPEIDSYRFTFGNSYHMPMLLLVYHRFHFSFVFAWSLIGLVFSPGRCFCSVYSHARYPKIYMASMRGNCLWNIFYVFFLGWPFLRAVRSAPRWVFIVLLKFKINIYCTVENNGIAYVWCV